MHKRFDSDEEELPGPSGAGAAVRTAPCGPHASFPTAQNFQCVSSVRVDFDQKDQCYVFELAHSPGAGLVAAALSNRRIKLFNFGEGGLQFAGDLLGHTGMLQELRFCLPDAPHLLHSCAADGTVRGWDARVGQQVESYSVNRLELLSCSTNGTLVAAGGGDKILFWDRRTQRPIASWDDTHAQDVTQVAFHPAHPSVLVSGSEDGLVAVFDTAPQLDEDEGFKAALNIDTSVAKLGFYGPGGAKLWARSGVESLHLWEWQAACNDEATGGNGALGEALNAREQLTVAAASCAAGQVLAPGVDYLVGCEYNAAADQLWVMAGNNAGAVGFFPVVEPPAAGQQPAAGDGAATAAQQAPLFGAPAAALPSGAGAHGDVVRSVLWPGAAGGMCLSGGEDSKGRFWTLVRAAAADEPAPEEKETFALQAPSKPKSPVGEMAAYYLAMQPHLFRDAVATAFQRITEARAAEAAVEAAEEEKQQQQREQQEGAPDSADLVLYRRMAEVKRVEQMAAIEDLMYVCILEKFQEIGVDMLPQIAPIEESTVTLRALTEGVHSREAIDMVKEHVLAVLGPASMAFSNTMIKMSKLQAAQVYAASIMFGYFLRRVDKRFQLAQQLGVLPEGREDAVARLERLFAQADAVESVSDPDTAPPLEPVDPDSPPSTSYSTSTSSSSSGPSAAAGGLVKREKSALRRYVESFDQETMMETARLVTVESAQLTERQTQALFGDIKQLQREMQEAVGQDASSMEEIMTRVQSAVADGKVDSVVMTVGTQRRAVLEAVAYGCFLRDVESWVGGEWEGLLTPIASAAGEV